MGLCECEGSHRVNQVGSWDGCPLEGFGHTSFSVNECLDCGGISFFPPENGKIALEKGTPETKQKLAEIIAQSEMKTDNLIQLTVRALTFEHRIVIEGLYNQILKHDPEWHFFYEGPETFLRVSPEFVDQVTTFLSDQGFEIINNGKWEEPWKITQKHQFLFQKLFHIYSELAMHLPYDPHKDDEEFYRCLDRVCHCFLNNCMTKARYKETVGTDGNLSGIYFGFEAIALCKIATFRSYTIGQIMAP